ncbi:MAG: flagellar basal body-associated FliL family protein [Rhodospirillales bacterium]
MSWPAVRRAGLGLVVVLAVTGGGFAFIAGAAPDRVDLDLGAPSIFYALPEVVTDLDSGSGRPRYVRLALVLEVPKTDTDVLQAGEPAILDAVQQHLRTLRAADLAGGAGTQLLRQTVREIVERRIRPTELRGVLLTQFLVN